MEELDLIVNSVCVYGFYSSNTNAIWLVRNEAITFTRKREKNNIASSSFLINQVSKNNKYRQVSAYIILVFPLKNIKFYH